MVLLGSRATSSASCFTLSMSQPAGTLFSGGGLELRELEVMPMKQQPNKGTAITRVTIKENICSCFFICLPFSLPSAVCTAPHFGQVSAVSANCLRQT